MSAVILFMLLVSVALYYGLQYCFPEQNDDALFLGIIELSLSAAVIGVLVAIALPLYSDYIEQAKNISALSETTGLKTDATVHYAIHGKWPEKMPTENGSTELSLKWLPDATIIATRKDTKKSLGFKPVIARSAEGTEVDSILWLCGYAKAPSAFGFTDNAKNHTSIPETQLASACGQ